MKNKLDLTTSWQKSIAILILLGLGFIVVKFLPVFIMAGIIGLGLIFYRPIWNGLKMLSWYSTKWLIKNNVVYYLNKSYDHLQKEFKEFSKATDDVGADMILVDNQMKDLEFKRKKSTELHARTQNIKLQEQYEAEVYSIKEQSDYLKPILEKVKNQYLIMRQIEEMREQDLKLFKIKLDAQIQKYEILKNLNNASDKAIKFIGNTNSNQEKEYKESMKQLEKSVAGYMVNIEQTNKKMLPELDKFTVNQSYNQNKGKEIINAYQKVRLDLN